MKKIMGSFIGVILLVAASATAQTSELIQVKVPFPFVTAGKSWPAADYRVQIRRENSTLTLTSLGLPGATMLTTSETRPSDAGTYLKFHCSGNQWVLQQVMLGGTAQIVPGGSGKDTNVASSCTETATDRSIAVR